VFHTEAHIETVVEGSLGKLPGKNSINLFDKRTENLIQSIDEFLKTNLTKEVSDFHCNFQFNSRENLLL
jgi:hypothetical protein